MYNFINQQEHINLKFDSLKKHVYVIVWFSVVVVCWKMSWIFLMYWELLKKYDTCFSSDLIFYKDTLIVVLII